MSSTAGEDSEADDKTLADIQKRLASSDRLLACYRRVVGHDLPNQLIAVQGLIQILKLEEHDRLSPDGRDYLDRLSGTAGRAQSVLRILTDIGRVRLVPIVMEPISLYLLAREAEAEVSQLFPRRAVAYHLPSDLPALRLDRHAGRQVLVQLFRNAIQAVPSQREASVGVVATLGNIGSEFAVTDNGDGMTDERLAQLRAFFAGTASLGTGLGLFLVREIVDFWGGHVDVQSVAGQGSVFTIHVPVS